MALSRWNQRPGKRGSLFSFVCLFILFVFFICLLVFCFGQIVILILLRLEADKENFRSQLDAAARKRKIEVEDEVNSRKRKFIEGEDELDATKKKVTEDEVDAKKTRASKVFFRKSSG